MNCSIFCLVSRLDQVQPLMARMTDAGVPSEHVTMVFRSGDCWLSRKAHEMPEVAASMWEAPFVSLALWWELAAVGLSATQGAAPDEGERQHRAGQIVPPYVFTSKLLGKRGH